jgi:excinuclease UvrABC nuclease subunit
MAGKLSVASGGAIRRSPVPGWVPADLPAAPGVYQFEAEGGTALYVGKSVNLRRRVRGYFYGGGPNSARTAEMLALARGVAWRATGSDLEARLEEACRIVSARPVYNRALRNRARGWYLEIDWRDPFPRLAVVRAPRRPGARHFGPYRGRAAPERVARLLERAFGLRSCAGRVRPDPAGSPCLAHGIGLCGAPCIAAIGLTEYRARVEAAARALADPRYARALRTRLEGERSAASDALAYERAADRQRRMAWLDELEEERAALERPWVERSWMVGLPHARPGRSVLIGMVRGRVLPGREVDWAEPSRDAAVADACYAARVAELACASVLEPTELVTSLIVSGWLMDGAPGGIALDLDRLSDAEVARRLAADPPTR